jgi:hypothetical protein
VPKEVKFKDLALNRVILMACPVFYETSEAILHGLQYGERQQLHKVLNIQQGTNEV